MKTFKKLTIFLFSVQILAFNQTDSALFKSERDLPLMLASGLVSMVPDGEFMSPVKFAASLALGLKSPRSMVAPLFVQGSWDPISQSAGLSMANILTAKYAEKQGFSLSKGFLVASGLNGVVIFFTSPKGILGGHRSILLDNKIWHAIAQAMEEGLVERGHARPQAQLYSSYAQVTLGFFALINLSILNIDLEDRAALAFAQDAGLRLLPAMVEIYVPSKAVKEALKIAFGLPVIYWVSTRIKPKLEKDPLGLFAYGFVQTTGISFLIGTVSQGWTLIVGD